MSSATRAAVIASLADAIASRAATTPGHPLRVGIDGPDGSGKTMLRAELAEELRGRKAGVIEASVDSFHQPRVVRYAMGRHSWEGYWAGAFDYPRLMADLLDPLGPGGNLQYRTASLDLASDTPVDGEWLTAHPSAILLIDGVLLQRRELVGRLDMVIYLEVPFTETYVRLAQREGFPTDPEAASNLRYTQTQRHYQGTCDPKGRADIVLDNTDITAPVILRA